MTCKPSVVWEFFVKNEDSMVCKLCPDGSTRGNLKGTLAGNAKKHLSYHHKVEHEDIVARDSNRITVAGSFATVVSDTESLEAGDDDAYEEIMRKKRRMQKRASSQQQQNSELGRNGDEVQKYLDAVLYADFGSTDPLEWWRQAGLAMGARKGRTLEDLLDMKLMVHINENMSGIR
ncbi:hypothetical protein AAVH_36388 [Aphelenchoides avenae]|nr:hypothetical protein AAVH_36388 [Aphelenchus avenae]